MTTPFQSRSEKLLLWFNELGISDVPLVGGKNASLGEMTRSLLKSGVNVPSGFATTAHAYRVFIAENDLEPQISRLLNGLDIRDIPKLRSVAADIRQRMEAAPLPEEVVAAVKAVYPQLCDQPGITLAVRSSATAEDLPDASFAGQQETFLNVSGLDDLLTAIRRAYASVFTDRAIVYREQKGYDHMKVALSAGIQRMVRADLGAAGVIFTVDTESGFADAVFITAAYGLGETVVQGIVNPDEFYVYKPALVADRSNILSRRLGTKLKKMVYAENEQNTRIVAVPAAEQQQFALSDEEVSLLARQAVTIEAYYGRPMDIEWGKDGLDGKIYILQARPETVHSQQDSQIVERYRLQQPPPPIIDGYAVGRRVGSGKARIIDSLDKLDLLQPGEILVAEQTDPDWGPVMNRAAGIVTNHGGRACHAAIVARELGIPAVIGCGNATTAISDGSLVTVSCAEGEQGHVYPGEVSYETDRIHLGEMPDVPVDMMLNLANPYQAFELSRIPSAGVGLARTEFIINRMIGIHPQAVLAFDTLPGPVRRAILQKTAGYPDPVEYYVSRLTQGIALLGAAFFPRPVIVRTSDFKSNEYAHLLGGDTFEPDEENPMLGFRGAARYTSAAFRPAFELECRALKRVREDIGLTNVEIMIPFVRTTDEAADVTRILQENGLERGVNDLRVIMMCEIPANVILADDFLQYFDGFSIGSNDLTQLTLGVDRDSERLAYLFDERNEAVKRLIQQAITACRNQDRYIGICGQAPSDYPDFADWLVDAGIGSLSLNPDALLETWMQIAVGRDDAR